MEENLSSSFPIDFDSLLVAAQEARFRAYAPYSGFRVGAAILTDKGKIVQGCNVENASYGLALCAERVAMASARIQQAGSPIAIVIVGNEGESCPPCGACRQFLAEFNPHMRIFFREQGEWIEALLSTLLPHGFHLRGEKE